MMKLLLITAFTLLLSINLSAKLLINEIACNTSGDWVELVFTGPEKASMDISDLYVTMYYGDNEPLGIEPITIYSYDRPETPYNDRFIVVHLTEPFIKDETDFTGDTNQNGQIDVYCDNYFSSLWNTDCVVAIDNDDDPGNGGIIDFAFYSNNDGSPSNTIVSYVEAAQQNNQWQPCQDQSIQSCAIPIGKEGILPFQSISRKNSRDTNTKNDFSVTSFQTPGKANIPLPQFWGKRLFKPLRKCLTLVPRHGILGKGEIPLFIFWVCNIKFRIFTVTGIQVYESPLFTAVKPGFLSLYWNPFIQRSTISTGLYLCKIEAVNPILRKTDETVIYIVMSRYK